MFWRLFLMLRNYSVSIADGSQLSGAIASLQLTAWNSQLTHWKSGTLRGNLCLLSHRSLSNQSKKETISSPFKPFLTLSVAELATSSSSSGHGQSPMSLSSPEQKEMPWDCKRKRLQVYSFLRYRLLRHVHISISSLCYSRWTCGSNGVTLWDSIRCCKLCCF